MYRARKYVLNSKNEPTVVDDTELWAAAFEANKIVKQELVTELGGLWTPFEPPWVSTVFLGLDHNWSNEGPPIVFETMIFNGVYDQKGQWRYATWDEAVEGHERTVNMVKDPICMIGQIEHDFWYWWKYNGSVTLELWTRRLDRIMKEVSWKKQKERFYTLVELVKLKPKLVTKLRLIKKEERKSKEDG